MREPDPLTSRRVLWATPLFLALAAMIHRFEYLKYALALVLVFIGGKIFVSGFVGKVPPAVSLGVTAALIAGGIAFLAVEDGAPARGGHGVKARRERASP